MIRITDSAATQLHELLKDRATAGRRTGRSAEKAGWAGLQYAMKIGGRLPDDEVIEKNGVYFYVDPASGHYLRDCEVDYVDTLADRGFKIHNPNAARSCGCGSSFEPVAAGPVSSAPPVPDGEACTSGT